MTLQYALERNNMKIKGLDEKDYISLEEAFQAIQHGEQVICEANGEKHTYQIQGDISLCLDKFIMKFYLNDLINGKWYIVKGVN